MSFDDDDAEAAAAAWNVLAQRDAAIAAMMAAGKTRAQAEAFLELTASAFRRRGWLDGEPLPDDKRAELFRIFMGDAP